MDGMLSDWIGRTLARMSHGKTPLVDPGHEAPTNPPEMSRQDLYAAAVHSSDLAFLTTDLDGVLTGWNAGAERLFGYTADEVLGRNIDMLVPADRRDEIDMIRERFRKGRRIESFATVRNGKDGKPIHVVFEVSPIRLASGEFVGSSGIVRDVSEQRLAEELFRLAVEACPSGMMMVDRSARILMVNSEVENLFGYARDELLGRSVNMLVPPAHRSQHDMLWASFIKRPQSQVLGRGRELTGLRRDGSEIPLELELNVVRIRDGFLILAIVVDISDRKRNERLKDEFVSTVSHELRTPLTSISASLALLASGTAGALPAPALRLVNIAHANGQRLVRLVNDILDIEKIESGKTVFQIERVAAGRLVELALESSRPYADEMGVSLHLEAESEVADVQADPDRLAQVVTNLLSNAIKFSPRGGEVHLSIADHGEMVRISVRDRGAGIPDEFKPRVFDKFAQADATDARRKGGTGLGLSIVKHIVERLGGDIGFESEVGIGTAFHVDIPQWREDDGKAGTGEKATGAVEDSDVTPGNQEVA